MQITLGKALEILQLNVKEAGKKMSPDTLASLKLLIALGLAVQYVRSDGSWDFHALLPDE